MNVVFPIVLVFAVVALAAALVVAGRRDRNVRSLERAEREGARGAEGLRHAKQRASTEWVENSMPGQTRPIGDVVDSAIADSDRVHRRR